MPLVDDCRKRQRSYLHLCGSRFGPLVNEAAFHPIRAPEWIETRLVDDSAGQKPVPLTTRPQNPRPRWPRTRLVDDLGPKVPPSLAKGALAGGGPDAPPIRGHPTRPRRANPPAPRQPATVARSCTSRHPADVGQCTQRRRADAPRRAPRDQSHRPSHGRSRTGERVCPTSRYGR